MFRKGLASQVSNVEKDMSNQDYFSRDNILPMNEFNWKHQGQQVFYCWLSDIPKKMLQQLGPLLFSYVSKMLYLFLHIYQEITDCCLRQCLLGISLFGKSKNFFNDIQSRAWFTILEPMHLDFLVCDVPIVALSSPILG